MVKFFTKSHSTFSQELFKLLSFYKATLYSYEQTEEVLRFRKEKKIKYEIPLTNGLIIFQPHYYKINKNAIVDIRNNLCELIFVRIISALEIFFIDLIKEIFVINKEPFKRQDVFQNYSQAELLSIKSTSEIYNKIINRECRKLSNGGFLETVKFYRKYFNLDMGSFSPGLKKIEEYHDRRHILVHRLGKTDQLFRKKYNYSGSTIIIDDNYLKECFSEFKSFSEMVNNQIFYQFVTELELKPQKEKIIEREVVIEIDYSNMDKPELIEPKYEFWSDDEYLMLNDIMREKNVIEGKCILTLSGISRHIEVYLKIIRRYQKRSLIKVKIITDKFIKTIKKSKKSILDEKLLEEIKNKLPEQPWAQGTHKVVAKELNIPNNIVFMGIYQLMAKGIFKPQINGKIIEKSENKIEKEL